MQYIIYVHEDATTPQTSLYVVANAIFFYIDIDPVHFLYIICICLRVFYVRFSTLLHLLPLRFHWVGGCWDRTQGCCDFGGDSQTLLGIVVRT
jgi:hypothetical protein